ncbi:coproporphyrinogen III oxidase [Clostridium paridis]|uniref:Coproporphyrinogen III oxidase n=1 Tax=Clostridium paridis TaxID=2803863 RepID=A0A937K433_9CLOT|nr:coproporphyrinogen III oxidase [Clostridium paridis]MBL4931123.1 coproporphyrinogen III oxidase [Clostridium paridis]
MILNITLSDENLRYDVYQMFNIFFPLEDIKINRADDFDYKITIKDSLLIIENKEVLREVSLEEDGKESVKRELFKLLSELTKDYYPWGTLIGIRPSKIALSLLNEGKSKEEIREYFKNKYLTSKEKSDLCIEIAEREKGFVDVKKEKISIYIGMAFCPTRCLYCSFASNPIAGAKKQVEPYISALKKEIDAMSKYISSKQLEVNTVYFGGGTPTSVDNEEFEGLMAEIYNNLIEPFNPIEYTVECGRPDSITKEKLETMKRYRVDRISINPQSMNDVTLKNIGRGHTKEQVINKFNLARSLGFDNINMDIIVGLPGEGIDEINNTFIDILKLKPESLTVHGMSIKRASRLHEELILGKKLYRPAQDELNRMYEKTRELAMDLKMEPYYMYRQKNMVGNMENVGYSLSNKECIYNMLMIEDTETIIAIGADAVSKVVFHDENRIERFGNVKDVKEYVNRIDEMIQGKIDLLDTLYE